MASKGARVGMGAASGAASGAAIGSAIGPWGTAIGGAVGAIGGGLAGLLTASDEAKQRRQAEAELRGQAQEEAQREWERRVAAISGLTSNPLYLAMSYDPYDPAQVNQQIDQHLDRAMPEWQPDYGQLIGQFANAAGTVGKNAHAQQWGGGKPAPNPWAAYAPREPDWSTVSREQLLDAYRRGKISY